MVHPYLTLFGTNRDKLEEQHRDATPGFRMIVVLDSLQRETPARTYPNGHECLHRLVHLLYILWLRNLNQT